MKTLANKSFQELRNLAITQVYCNDILSFGFTLNDGSVCKDERGNFNFFHTFDPVSKITSIEHIFYKDEFRILQMNFYHHKKRLVFLGKSDDIVTEQYRGRTEVFEIADDEQLIGCKVELSSFFYGVTWKKMKVFTI